MVTFNSLKEISISEKTAVAIGFFDGIHKGHQKVINTALEYKKKGCKVCVFSFSISQNGYNKERTNLKILSIQDKTDFLESMGVDYFVNPDFSEIKELSPYEYVRDILYKKLNTQVVCCGFDFHYGKMASGNTKTLEHDCTDFGITVNVVDSVNIEGLVASSTVIRKAILHGDMDTAANILGRSYYYTLPVIQGKKLGRTLGFPTINQCFTSEQAEPPSGVYASTAKIDGTNYHAVTSIGKNPTVGGKNTVSETYIMGMNRDLYGKNVTISLCKFLRPQYKFESIEKLSEQISEDVESSKKFFHDI